MDFIETVTACDLKVGRFNEDMRVFEVKVISCVFSEIKISDHFSELPVRRKVYTSLGNIIKVKTNIWRLITCSFTVPFRLKTYRDFQSVKALSHLSANGRVTDSKILCPFVSVRMRFLSVPRAVNAFRVR